MITGSKIERKTAFINDTEIKLKIYLPPETEKRKRLVIFTHGLGYCDRQYDINTSHILSAGYILCTYNLRGHGGNTSIWTLEESVKDLSELITYLQSEYLKNNNINIYLLGHSTGSLINLLTVLNDKRVQAASAITTVTRLLHSYLYWFESGYNNDVKKYFAIQGIVPSIINKFMTNLDMYNKFIEHKIPSKDLEVPHRYGMLRSLSWNQFFSEIVYTTDLLNQANKIKIPVILFRGQDDEVMDVKKTDDLYEAISKNTTSKLIKTNSYNHFQTGSWDQIINETILFFNKFSPVEQFLKS